MIREVLTMLATGPAFKITILYSLYRTLFSSITCASEYNKDLKYSDWYPKWFKCQGIRLKSPDVFSHIKQVDI